MKNNTVWLLRFVLCLLIVLIFFLLFQRYGNKTDLAPDATLYYEISQAILSGEAETVSGRDIGDVVMPGYSFFMAVFFYVVGNQLHFFIVFQVLLAAISVVLFFELSHRVLRLNPFLSFVIALLLLAYYPLWRMAFTPMIEVLTVVLLIVSVYLVGITINRGQPRYLYLLFVFFGVFIAIMNRYAFHFFVLGACAFIFFIWKNNFKNITIKHLMMAGFFLLMVLLPWHYRQYQVYEKVVVFSPVRTDQAVKVHKNDRQFSTYEETRENLLSGGFSHYRKKRVENEFSEEVFNELVKKHQNRTKTQIVLSRLQGFFTVWENKFRTGYGKDIRITPPASFENRIVNLLVWGWGYVFFLPGIFFAIRYQNYLILVLSILFFSHVFLHVYFDYLHRYRSTILPVLLMVSAYGFENLWCEGKKIFLSMNKKYRQLD